jgi:FtsZ-binding cell division protein ZapB
MSEHSRPGGNPASGQPLRFPVPDLASLLGVSEQAVLEQIERGELLAIEEEGGWMVYVDLPEVAQPAAADNPGPGSSGAEPPHDEVLSVTHAVEGRINETAERAPALPVPVAIPVSPVDLTLLINLVTDLTKRNAELLESTATWRERVQHLEGELQRVMIAASTPDEHLEPELPAIGDAAVESSKLEEERAARFAAEAEIARLQVELREIRQLQNVLQNAFQDPAARTAAGWRNESPEPAHGKPSWWRRMVGGS